MTTAIYKSLLNALKHQDFEGFHTIIKSVGLPRDESYIDYTLLIKAIKLGCKRIAHLLLDEGARVFKKQGVISPLHVAVIKAGWKKVIERLLAKGAKVSGKNSRGDTALHVAFAHRAPGQLIDFLLKKYLEENDENLANKEKLTLLHIACTRPHVDVVEQLIGLKRCGLSNQRVSMRSKTAYAGWTPMHFAVAHGNHEVVDFLLKISRNSIYSADVNQSSPLHLAAERRDVKMIDLILRHDQARHICINKDGLTHFMAACMGSDASVVEDYLLAAEERPWVLSAAVLMNSRVRSHGDFGGYTPLHFAAEYGRADTIDHLLNEGADCCTTTHRGFSVHELAKENVRDVLQSHCNVFKECQDMHVANYDFGDLNGNYTEDVKV